MEAEQAQKKPISDLSQDSSDELAAEAAEVNNLLDKISAIDGLPAGLKEKLLEERAQFEARLKVLENTKAAREAVAEKKQMVMVTVAAAAGGAVSLGASGGVVGLAGGGAVGAALGIVPAIFTLGLSIPVGAAIGAGIGLVVGTAAGGTLGLVGGGATGYGAYTKRKEICTGAEEAWSKAMDCGEYIQAKATISKEFVKHHIAC